MLHGCAWMAAFFFLPSSFVCLFFFPFFLLWGFWRGGGGVKGGLIREVGSLGLGGPLFL